MTKWLPCAHMRWVYVAIECDDNDEATQMYLWHWENTFKLCIIIFIRHFDPMPSIFRVPGIRLVWSVAVVSTFGCQTSTQAFFTRVWIYLLFFGQMCRCQRRTLAASRMCDYMRNFSKWTCVRCVLSAPRSIVIVFSRSSWVIVYNQLL